MATPVRELLISFGFHVDTSKLDKLDATINSIASKSQTINMRAERMLENFNEQASGIQFRFKHIAQHGAEVAKQSGEIAKASLKASTGITSASMRMSLGIRQNLNGIAQVMDRTGKATDRFMARTKKAASKTFLYRGSVREGTQNVLARGKDFLGGGFGQFLGSALMGSQGGMNPVQALGFPLMIGLGGPTAAIAAAGSVVGALGYAAVRTSVSFQQLKVTLDAFLGSRAETDKYFKQIQKFAESTSFSVEDVTKYFAVLVGKGTRPEDALVQLRGFADAAAGVQSVVPNALDIIVRAVTQTSDKLRGQELYQQLGNAALPLLEEMAKQEGKNVQEIRKMVEEGELAKETLIKAFTEPIGPMKVFKGLSKEIAVNTTFGRWQNLGEKINRILGEEEGGINRILISGLDMIDRQLDNIAAKMQKTFAILGEGDALKGAQRFFYVMELGIRWNIWLMDTLLVQVMRLLKAFSHVDKFARLLTWTVAGGITGSVVPGVGTLVGATTGALGYLAAEGFSNKNSAEMYSNMGNSATTSASYPMGRGMTTTNFGDIIVNVSGETGLTPEQMTTSVQEGVQKMVREEYNRANQQFVASGLQFKSAK